MYGVLFANIVTYWYILEEFIYEIAIVTLFSTFNQEWLMVKTLQFNMSVPTPYVFMKRFLQATQSDKQVLYYYTLRVFKIKYDCFILPNNIFIFIFVL